MCLGYRSSYQILWKILEQRVDIRDDIFSIFHLNGFNLCLFNPQKVKEKITYGDNCLLSFKVDNMTDFKKKLENLKVEIVYPLTKSETIGF